MINYKVLKDTNIFYILFEVNPNKINVESLINNWYRRWFDEKSYCTFDWLTNEELKVYVNFENIFDIDYKGYDFLIGNFALNSKGLYQILKYGVKNSITQIKSINIPFFITTNLKFLSINKEHNLTEKILDELEIVFNEYKNNKYSLKRLNKIIDLYEKYKILNTNTQQFKEEYEHYFSNYYDNT